VRVAIVGSREIGCEIDRCEEIGDLLDTLPRDTIIVSGGARGIDRIAAQLAGNRGMGVCVHHPDWDGLGKRAGFVRNAKIVDDCDEVHAWWDGKSKGTAHTIELARKAGKPVTIHRI
jgi:YspA, cpYpsA-related SLOG family